MWIEVCVILHHPHTGVAQLTLLYIIGVQVWYSNNLCIGSPDACTGVANRCVLFYIKAMEMQRKNQYVYCQLCTFVVLKSGVISL